MAIITLIVLLLLEHTNNKNENDRQDLGKS